MNKVLQFYDYEKCFQHYAERIAHMRQAKVRDEVIAECRCAKAALSPVARAVLRRRSLHAAKALR